MIWSILLGGHHFILISLSIVAVLGAFLNSCQEKPVLRCIKCVFLSGGLSNVFDREKEPSRGKTPLKGG
jgi:lipoprotein signal peptidase